MTAFKFRVFGKEDSYGTIVRDFEQEGEIEAEGMGSALDQLVTRDLWWDTLDTTRPVTIEIEPVEDSDGSRSDPTSPERSRDG